MGKTHDVSVKINVTNLHLAKASIVGNAITFEAPERIVGLEEVGRKPNVASGELYGDGKIRKKVSKKTGYDLTINHNSLPVEWLRYMEGAKVSETGVESGTSKDEPGIFAIGWEVEKTEEHSQLIWFLYCTAEPREDSGKQSESNTNFTSDSITIKALEHDSLGRYYTLIDTEDEKVTDEMVKNFFTKVQVSDVIEKGTETVHEEVKGK